MRHLRRTWERLRGLSAGKNAQADAEMERELAVHLALLEEEYLREGVKPAEARRLARIRMGGMEQVRIMHREERGMPFVESLLDDLRFGWRQLWKRRVTTVAAVLSLALAMGSCMTVFRLVDSIFLRPLPIQNPDRLYLLQEFFELTKGESNFNAASLPYPTYLQLREVVKGQATLLAMAQPWMTDITYKTDAETERAKVQYVSGGMFAAFGLGPAAGRLLTEADDRAAGSGPYAVISYDYWQSRFARDANVVGRTLKVNDALLQIVGVAPKGFAGTDQAQPTDIFVPMTMRGPQYISGAGIVWFSTYAMPVQGSRVDVLVQQIEAKVTALNQTQYDEMMNQSYPGKKHRTLKPMVMRLLPAGRGSWMMQEGAGLALGAIGALVIMILLIACVNVANLMNAQAAARSREMAVRVSLGAGRGRLVRLMLLEGALLAAMASVVGVLFSWWTTPLIVSGVHVGSIPVRLVLSADWRVLAFALGMTALVVLLFGLMPALRASRVRPVSALKGGEKPRGGLRWMQGLIGAQVAFCVVVLFVGGLFVTTLRRLAEQPLGFVPEHTLLLNAVSQTKVPPAQWMQLADRLAGAPGVETAAAEQWSPLSGAMWMSVVTVKGAGRDGNDAYLMGVGPRWTSAMGMRLTEGRDFRLDGSDTDVALVNRAFVKQFLGGQNALGKTFGLQDGKAQHPYVVIGVTDDAVYSDVHDPVPPVAYMALAGKQVNALMTPQRMATMVLRTRGDPMAIAETLRRQVGSWYPEIRVSTVQTQTELVQAQMIRERLLAMLGGFFALVALLLAGIGLYGVLHYSVVQREREIGIRIALGAAAGNIARIVTVRVMLMVLAGAAVGLGSGLASVRFVQTLLYGVKGTDAPMLILPAAVLLCAAALAALPAVLRAVRVDPAVMLRAE